MTKSTSKVKIIKARKVSIKATSESVVLNTSDAQFKLNELLSDIASDPQKATNFLKRAGIITKAGSLAPDYA